MPVYIYVIFTVLETNLEIFTNIYRQIKNKHKQLWIKNTIVFSRTKPI